MKTLFCLVIIFYSAFGLSQTWQTIDAMEGVSLKINPYTNAIWVFGNATMTTFENNGDYHKFYVAYIGDQGLTGNLDMTFTPGHTFYSKEGSGYGLYLFDNYTTSHVLFMDGIEGLKADGDTIFLVKDQLFSQKYLLFQQVEDLYNCFGDYVSKNGEIYMGPYMRYYTGQQHYDMVSQPFYLNSQCNTFSYSNLSNIMFMGHETGLSKALNGVCFDTITPNNTINMPSGNVLEIEFDKNDSLWCLFGDANDDPFAIATLHGDTWVNRIDASNSPIEFDNYFAGFEFDTLGNLWVASHNELHTLIGPNSPAWLSTMEEVKTTSVELFPNPTTDEIQLTIDDNDFNALENMVLYDAKGTPLNVLQPSKTLRLNTLPKGVYFLHLKFEDGTVLRKKFIKL